MNRFKKLLTLTVLSALTALQPLTALADSVTAPGQASSSAVITADATLLSVTVPTSVLIYVNSAGDVLTPDNMSIVNNSAAPILVKSLAVQTEGGWTLDAASTDYSRSKVGRKNFSLTFNGQDPAAGALAFETPINGASALDLVLSADVAPQKEAINAVKIGNIVITVGWYADEEPDKGSNPAGYVLATDADFSGDYDGGFKYIGTAEYVTIPDVIKGIPVTNYRNMFTMTSVKGVQSTNPNITNMQSMFTNATASSLELDLNTSSVTNMTSMFGNAAAENISFGTFETQNVTKMDQMFSGTKVKNLDLSDWNTANVTSMIGTFNNAQSSTINLNGWNTSKVTNLNNMFRGSKALELDLSSFDTTAVSWMQSTFMDALATTVYVRSQADADKLKESSDLPAGLTFVVK